MNRLYYSIIVLSIVTFIHSIVIEFKSVADVNELEQALQQGLQQIDVYRYSAELNPHKPLIKTAVAFCGKYCLVDSVIHVWQ